MPAEIDNISIIQSPLGLLKIESTEEAICAISILGDSDVQISEGSNPLLLECSRQLELYFKGELSEFTFPMEQSGTPFQQSVWKALQDIPAGTYISYAKVSRMIGNPAAVRAVGMTNGKNKIAIAIPCHRVIGKNGALTGYAGGLEAKRWLLAHELQHYKNSLSLF